MEDSLGRDWIVQAQEYLRMAREAVRIGMLAIAVRQAQTSVELSLKAALRWSGIDHPREHDVSDAIRAEIERFPPWFREAMDTALPLSSELVRQRQIALYGLEREGKPPSKVFTDPAAVQRFVSLARRAHKLALRLYSTRGR